MGSTFFERYAELCKSAGKSPNSVARIVGASSGSVTAWKNGTEPRNSTIVKIANYFNVPVEYLLGNENAPTTDGERKVSDEDIKFALFGGSGDITDAMMDEVRSFAAYVKQREEQKKKKE